MNLSNYKNITSKQKIINLILLFLLFLTATSFLLYIFINRIKLLKNDIISQKISIQEKIIEGQNQSIVVNKLRKIEPQMEKFDQIYINRNRELEFITTLENIANTYNITQKINLVMPKDLNTTSYVLTPISIDASGTYTNLVKYINKIETLNYYINISQLEFTASSDNQNNALIQDNSNQIINLKLSADTYWK